MLSIKQFTFNPFSENTYLIYNSDKECYIVDPGMYSIQEENKIMSFIENEGLHLKKILNTHAHIDHILGIDFIKGKFQVPFGLHKDDIPVLQNAWLSANMFQLKLNQIPSMDFEIIAGQEITLGTETLEVIHLPGHSPGSVGFYYPAGNWIIAGDVLFQRSIGRTDLPGGDFDTLARSIRSSLYQLPSQTIVFPGHGDPTTIAEEMKLNPFVKALDV